LKEIQQINFDLNKELWSDDSYKHIQDIRNLIIMAAASYGDKIYIRSSNEDDPNISFIELLIWASNFEKYLEQNKVQAGEKISVIFHNSSLMVLLFLSTLFAKRVFVPINPLCSSNEIDYILNDSEAKILFFDGHLKNKISLKNTLELKIEIKNQSEFIKDFLCENEKVGDVQSPVPNFPAQVVYTSGTTGDPKGVVLVHRNILADSYAIGKTFGFVKIDNFLTVTPLFHNSGQIMSTVGPLWCGGTTTAVRSDMGLLNFWYYVDKFNINWSLGMPTHVNFLLESSLQPGEKSMKGFFCGGAKLESESQNEFEERFGVPLYPNYGLTETTSIACCARPDDRLSAPGSVGRPLFINEVKITNAGCTQKPYEVGEILIKGENLFKEYLNKPNVTKENIKEGWLYTGDLGYMDEESNLFIVDRIDNMILVGGENVYPADVEKLIPMLNGISDAILVSIPDKILGNRLVLIYGMKKGEKADPVKWRKVFNANLSSYKIPKYFLNIKQLGKDQIPKAPNGKILRNEVKKLITNYYKKINTN